MRNFLSVRYFGLLILFALLLQGCASGWMQQRFDYLNKVAVVAQSESIIVERKIDSLKSTQRLSEKCCNTDTAADSSFSAKFYPDVKVKPHQISELLYFSTKESKDFAKKLFHTSKSEYNRGSLASVNGTSSIILGLLIFFGLLFLFYFLVYWAIEKQYGCLAIGFAVLGIFVLLLVILALM